MRGDEEGQTVCVAAVKWQPLASLRCANNESGKHCASNLAIAASSRQGTFAFV